MHHLLDQRQLCIWFHGCNYRQTTLSSNFIQRHRVWSPNDSKDKRGKWFENISCNSSMLTEYTLQIIEDHFSIKNGYKHNAEVIYGDTDSVMIKFGVDNLKEAMELGREGAKVVTEQFLRPINLDFEKVYFPYLLISKKRYAGLYWSNPDKYDKLDAKGIEVRYKAYYS